MSDKILKPDDGTKILRQVGDVYTSSGGGDGTNLSYTASPTNGIVNSDTGTDATIPATDGTNAGLLLPAEKTKLAGIEAGAEVNNISDVNATDLTDGGDTTLHTHDSRYYTESEANTLLNAKQDTLVSGTNIKTINSTSLLGSGDIPVSASVADGNKGDVTVSSSGTVWTINAQAITKAKLSTSVQASLDKADTALQIANIEGGNPTSVFGGTGAIDGGTPSTAF